MSLPVDGAISALFQHAVPARGRGAAGMGGAIKRILKTSPIPGVRSADV